MAKRKKILNAALKALLAGVQTSAWIKIPATFISEIASLPQDKRDALNAASEEKFAELLTQAELSTTNSALAAVGTEQIKVLVSNLTNLSADSLDALKNLTQQQYEEMQSELHAIHADTREIKEDVKKILEKPDSSAKSVTISQEGSGHTATAIEGDKNIVAGGNVTTGIDSEAALNVLVKTSKELGRSEEENIRLRQTVKQLEEQLAQSRALAGPGEQQVPQPTQQAKDLAAQIEDDAGPYAQALKAIADGENEKADSLLDQTQQFLDAVQQKKDQAQAKIYMARMQNASYAGKPKDALQYCDKLRTLAGDDSMVIDSIATVYYENAEYNEAEPLFERALKIDEVALGPEHPTVATDLNNLAMLYKATNRHKEAVPLMERALKIDESSLGPEHPTVAIRLNNLAMLYQDTNRLEEAEPLMERALKIDEAALGSEHPKVAIRLNNLAQLYQDTNRLKEAEPLMERALKIDEAAFGPEHPTVATDLNNLAQLYQDTNRLKDAEPLMQRVIKILEKSLGENHPNVATALNNLALLYQATNRLKEAEPLMQGALKIDEASLGAEHPTVAIRLNNLASLYKATNRLKEAEPLAKRALEILLKFTRRTGHPHPHLQGAINNYVALLMEMGQSKDQVTARLKRLAPEMFNQANGAAEEQ